MTDSGTAVEASQQLLAQLLAMAPSAILALVTLFLGAIAAVLAGRFVRGLLQRTGVEALAERLGVAKLLYAANIKLGFAHLAGRVTALAIALVALMMAAETVGLPGVAEGVAAVVEFLPKVVAAGVVALAGFVAADFASRLAEGFGRQRDDLVSPRLAANLVYYLLLAVFLTTAVQHLGLDTGLVDALIIVVTGVSMAGAALAVALGARGVVRDVLAAQYAKAQFPPGDHVVVGALSGTVVRYDAITVTIRTDDGAECVMPCSSLFPAEGVVVRRVP